MDQSKPPGNGPPPGLSAGFAHTVRENSEILHWTVAWFFVAGLAVALRVFIRTHLIKNFGWDDAIMVLSMMAYTVFMAVLVVVVHWARHRDDFAAGMPPTPSGAPTHGPHQVGKRDDVTYNIAYHNPLDELFYSRLLWQVQSLLYVGTICLTRCSVGMLFLRVIPKGTKTWARVTTHVLIWVNIIGTVITLFIDLLECRPIGATPGQPNADCMPTHVLPWSIILYSIISLIVDFSFALLPIGVLWGVAMRPGEKVGAVFLMSLGCFASASVIYRLALMKAANFLEVENGHLTMDPLGLQIEMLVSWTIEQASGITGGSVATFKPLFAWIIGLYRSFVPPVGILRRRRRPDPITIPNSFPAPLGTPATPITPGNNAYARRMAQYQNGQEFELVSNGSTHDTVSAPSNRSESPSPAEPERTPVSPTFPEYVRISSKQALISPVRVTTPTRLSPTPNTFTGRRTEGDPEKGDDKENEIPTSPTPSPREREFGTPLPTIFSGQVLDFSQSHTQSTLQSLPADYSDLFHGMPATLTESTLNSNGSGDSIGSPGPTRRYI